MHFDHVVIIGSGIAGLVNARIMADYAQRVTIIERDQPAAGAEPRRGAPQSQHVHFLLARGLLELDTIFPGFQDALLQDVGAPEVVIGQHTHFMVMGRWIPTMDTGLRTICASRPEIEQTLHGFIEKNPKISFLWHTDAVDLQVEGERVTGVVVRERGAGTDDRVVAADFVIDASGRHSKARQWLEKAGFPTPSSTRIDSRIGYATRWFEKPSSAANTWRVLYQFTAPPDQLRGGAILEHSRGRWLAGLIGINGDLPPTDEAGYMDFARTLPDPAFYAAIEHATPISSIVGYQNAPNEWHHYERLGRVPQGFVVTGDSLCVVNPVYGQGMTKAVLNARLLGQMLQSGTLTERAFYQRVTRVNQDFWDTAALGDMNYPGTASTAALSPVAQLKRRYLTAVLTASPRDEAVGLAFNRVLNVIDPATTLMMPGIFLRVLNAQRA